MRHPKSAILGWMLILTACGMDESAATSTLGPTPTPAPPSSVTTLSQFGFAAVVCDHDDPFDSADKTDYSDEVAGFTNLNQVCPTGIVATDTNRLIASANEFDPLLYIEPVFFDPSTGTARPTDQAQALWEGITQSIANSGVDPARIVFYLFDEPTLRGVALADLAPVATQIRAAYPASKILLVEAFSASSDPIVPDYVDLWAFNAYTVPDPAAEPLYTDYLDAAAAQLRDDQALVIIGDGIYTPFHANAGLSEEDMAQVARNYFNFAQSRNDVAALLVYSWAGGIDSDVERGTRNLPASVQNEWRAIGNAIVGD